MPDIKLAYRSGCNLLWQECIRATMLFPVPTDEDARHAYVGEVARRELVSMQAEEHPLAPSLERYFLKNTFLPTALNSAIPLIGPENIQVRFDYGRACGHVLYLRHRTAREFGKPSSLERIVKALQHPLRRYSEEYLRKAWKKLEFRRAAHLWLAAEMVPNWCDPDLVVRGKFVAIAKALIALAPNVKMDPVDLWTIPDSYGYGAITDIPFTPLLPEERTALGA